MGIAEFFIDDTDIVYRDGKSYKVLAEDDHAIISEMYNKIKDLYPEAYECLQGIYSNSAYFKWLFVRRFIKCNFGNLDNKADIRSDGSFRLEHVSCPLRGECRQENIICSPKFNTNLTKREIEVGQLIAKNYADIDIAEVLFISLDTAKNHRRNIEKKLDLPNKAAIMNYFITHNLVQNG